MHIGTHQAARSAKKVRTKTAGAHRKRRVSRQCGRHCWKGTGAESATNWNQQACKTKCWTRHVGGSRSNAHAQSPSKCRELWAPHQQGCSLRRRGSARCLHQRLDQAAVVAATAHGYAQLLSPQGSCFQARETQYTGRQRRCGKAQRERTAKPNRVQKSELDNWTHARATNSKRKENAKEGRDGARSRAQRQSPC